MATCSLPTAGTTSSVRCRSTPRRRRFSPEARRPGHEVAVGPVLCVHGAALCPQRCTLTAMVCRFAVMLDEGPAGFGGPRRTLAAHLTCSACGGHHAAALGARLPGGYRFRVAERLSDRPDGAGSAPQASPTHQCRDCGHLWTEVEAPT